MNIKTKKLCTVKHFFELAILYSDIIEELQSLQFDAHKAGIGNLAANSRMRQGLRKVRKKMKTLINNSILLERQNKNNNID